MTNEERAEAWMVRWCWARNRESLAGGIATLLDEAERRGRDAGLEEAARVPDDAREEGETDLRCIRNRIRALKSGGGT